MFNTEYKNSFQFYNTFAQKIQNIAVNIFVPQ